jgi:hypothetical protein
VKPGITSRCGARPRPPAALHGGQQRPRLVDLAAQPQAHVGGDLVVAAAAGVQALAGVAHQLGQARLDVQVHVFQLELPLEAPDSISAVICGHAALDVGQVLRADHALRLQHVGVRQAAVDVGRHRRLSKPRWRCSA